MDFETQIKTFVEAAEARAADGLTLHEAGQIFSELIGLAVSAAVELKNTGPEKKQFVLNAVSYLYDQIAPAISLPWFLAFFRPVIRPMLKSIVLSLADGAIEAWYRRTVAEPS